jgi:hypothetical protein
MALRQRRAGRTDHAQKVPVGEQDARQIGQRIPLDREEAEVDGDRGKAQVFPVRWLVGQGHRTRRKQRNRL